MFNLGLLKNIKQKGALFIEYAVVLAFVVVIGAFFISDGGIKNSIASIFGKAGDTIEVAVNGGEKPLKEFESDDYINLIKSFASIGKSMIKDNFPDRTMITSDDVAGVQKLKEVGIDIPEGNGNWTFFVFNSSGDYAIMWNETGRNVNIPTGDNVLMYDSFMGGGQYTTAKADLDENGKIIGQGFKTSQSKFYSLSANNGDHAKCYNALVNNWTNPTK